MKAHAEANAIKVEEINLNLSGNGNKDGFLDKVFRSICPVKYEKRYGKAAVQSIVSLRETVNAVLDHFPWFTEPQAFLFAQGYPLTPEQAANVFRVLEIAQQNDYSPYSVLEDAETRDRIIQGAQHAYDEDAAALWAAALNSERNAPGKVSKHTLEIMASMDSQEAQSFKKFVGCSLIKIGPNRAGTLLSLTNCEGLESFSLTREEADALDTLGLTRIHSNGIYVCEPFPFDDDGTLKIEIDGSEFLLMQKDDQGSKYCFPGLTKYGNELVSLCQPGDYPGFREAVKAWFGEQGISMKAL